MATRSEQKDAARAKAEQVISKRKQQETERVMNHERDRKAFDDKTARLRALRLAKEAADQTAGAAAHKPSKTAKRS